MTKTLAALLFLTLFNTPAFAAESLKEVDFPLGDPAAGREIFIRYSCYECHGVTHDASLPERTQRSVQGPLLGAAVERPASMLEDEMARLRAENNLPEADYRAENYAMSVIAPGHKIAPGFGGGSAEDEQATQMVNYSRFMTLTELRNLIAYLVQE